ncbi:MAG TPA: hypothetical protein DDZ76_14455 [Xanthomonadales bacterium]|nr:hypothetical protein [Xanthomonadales bacterium]
MSSNVGSPGDRIDSFDAFASADDDSIAGGGADALTAGDPFEDSFEDSFVEGDDFADSADDDADASFAGAIGADGDDGFDSDAFDSDGFDSDAFDAADQADDEFDLAIADGDALPTGAIMPVWSAFEAELADALDADGTDEFLGSLLGGFSRAAGRAARALRPVAQGATRVGSVARVAGQVAGGAGRLADTGATLARLLGQPGAARSFGRFGDIARGAERVASGASTVFSGLGRAPAGLRSAARLTGRAARANNPLAELLAQIGRLSAEGADDFEAFDTMADLYEDGVDAALPAAVGLASRLAARALGPGMLARLSPTARRAFVRGIAMAARNLVSGAGPEGVRALPRLAVSGVRAARASGASPARLPARTSQLVRRASAAAVRRPQAMTRLARPLAAPAPAALRSPGLGRGTPSIPRGTTRRFAFDGPVELTIRPL